MNKETIKTLNREECLETLKAIGQYASETCEDLKMKFRRSIRVCINIPTCNSPTNL